LSSVNFYLTQRIFSKARSNKKTNRLFYEPPLRALSRVEGRGNLIGIASSPLYGLLAMTVDRGLIWNLKLGFYL
jgi:hypothetical protein